MQLVARRTAVVDRLIVYPFVSLLVLIVARHSFFDHFDWPWSLILVFGLNLAYTLYCAVVLLAAAHGARKVALGRLQMQLAKLRATEHKDQASSVETILGEIRDLTNGAFAPWFEQSAVRAVLLPLGGAGALSLLELIPF